MEEARKAGIKAGLFRLKTIWPFPEEPVRELAEQVDAIIVVEMNTGKLVKEVQRVVEGKTRVISLAKVGGVLPFSREVLDTIRGEIQ